MKRLLIICILFPYLSYSQTWQWTKKEGGAYNDIGYSICTDGIGNCYAAVDLLGQAMILKYNSSGVLIWNTTVWAGHAKTIIFDNAGHLFVAGDSSNIIRIAKCDTTGTVILEISGSAGTCNGISLDHVGCIYLTGSGSFLQKYDTAGNLIWTRNLNAIGYSICTDDLFNCYITGKFSGSTQFGLINLIASGSQDIFVTKYDSSGNCIWAKRAGGNFDCCYSNDCGYAIATDNSGSIYFTGSIVDTVDFNSFTLVANSNDAFLAKYDTAGNALWVEQATGWIDQEGRCIALDNKTNIYIGGSYVPDMNFGNFTLNGWGNYDAFVAKYDSSGNFLKAIKAGGSTWNEYVYGICIDNSGNAFVTGSFSNTAYFGSDSLTSSGSYDIFVSKINLPTYHEEIKGNYFSANIYPNPSNGSITIETGTKINIHRLQITDLLGRIILQFQSINQSEFRINNLQSGTYIVTLFDKNNRSTNYKLIICK
jgi:hypothetical protein